MSDTEQSASDTEQSAQANQPDFELPPGFDVDVDAVIQHAKDRLEKLRQNEEDVQAIRIRHTSEDQACTAEVDGYGKLLSLSLTHGIDDKSGAEVSALVVETCADAARKALARYNEIIDAFNAAVEEDDANFAGGVRKPRPANPDS